MLTPKHRTFFAAAYAAPLLQAADDEPPPAPAPADPGETTPSNPSASGPEARPAG